MPAERTGMCDAREIIRLKFSSVSTHEIARWLNMALDGAGDLEAGGRRRPVLAHAGGHERRGAGGGALRQPTQQTRPPARRRAGLGQRAS